MKAFLLAFLPALVLGACGTPNLNCTTETCSVGTLTYQQCTSLTDETWNFGSSSCQASLGNSTQVQACAQQVATYCAGAGSGSGGTTTGGSSGGTSSGSPCSYTVTGSVTASGACSAEATFVAGKSNGLGFVVTAGAAFTFGATFASQTAPTNGTYANADASPGFGAEYLTGTTDVYEMCSDSSNCGGIAPQGTFSLTVTGPGPSEVAGGGTLWTSPQGTLTLTLPPDPNTSATGTVTITVTL